MKQLLLFVILFTVAFSACTKEGRILRKEDKLIGAWTFEKVFYKRHNAIFRDNITSDYEDDIIEFFPDYGASYDDYSLNSIFDGSWTLFVEDNAWDGENDLDFYVDAVFYDFVNNEDFFLFGGIDRLNRNKLHFEAEDRSGKYTFRLRRL